MPSNNILINGVLSYQISDKNMPNILEWFEQNGYDKQERKIRDSNSVEDRAETPIPCSQPES